MVNDYIIHIFYEFIYIMFFILEIIYWRQCVE